MRGTKAKFLRKLAKQNTQGGAPYEEYKSSNVNQIVPPNWAEYLETQKEGYSGPPVAPLFRPMFTATFSLVEGCTKNIYKQLKKASRG